MDLTKGTRLIYRLIATPQTTFMYFLVSLLFNQVCLYEIDAFSKSHALGQLRIDMKDVDITQRMTGWFDLYEEEEEVWTPVYRQHIIKIYVISIF